MDNIDNIKYEDFKKICRICMLKCGINFTKDFVILNVFHKLTDLHFDTNNEIPQQICLKCFEFINEIHAFSMTCKQSHSALMKCLNNYKSKRIKQEQERIEETNEEMEILAETNREIELHSEITIEEHKIEFVKDEDDWETNDTSNDEYLTTNNLENTNDLLIPTKIEEESINVINSKDLNKVSNSSDSKSNINIISLKNNNRKTRDKQNNSKISIKTSFKLRSAKCEHISKISNNMPTLYYKCNQCDKSLTGSSNFSRLRLHKCNLCEKTFTHSSYLKIHKRAHSDGKQQEQRPYKCDQCGKAFTQSWYLNQHRRAHIGEYPYKCMKCGKRFIDLVKLNIHKRVHSDASLD